MQTQTTHKAFIIVGIVFLLGYLDWLTTMTGVLLFGGVELNPLLHGLTTSSMTLFTVTKLTAVAFTGFAGYKAAELATRARSRWRMVGKFVNGGISLTVLLLCVVVVNNVIVVFGL